jgi:hypothetical protein
MRVRGGKRNFAKDAGLRMRGAGKTLKFNSLTPASRILHPSIFLSAGILAFDRYERPEQMKNPRTDRGRREGTGFN